MLYCHKGCIHKRTVPGNCHVRCAYPDSSNVTGDPHGIKNGWFFYPFLFDPIWDLAVETLKQRRNP